MRITRDDGLIDRDQAAELCGVSPDTITVWSTRGYVVTVTVNGTKHSERRRLAVAKRDGRRPLYQPVEVAKADNATRQRARRVVVREPA